MNQRIKELYKQAAGVRLPVTDFVLEDWEKEFAELIIKECAKMAGNLSPHGVLAENAIKEHFGVK